MNRLIKVLDKFFSEYVRQRDADHLGLVKCCTCNKIDHWKNMDCGHFMSRRHMSTRFDERNTGPQCKKCNIFDQGRQFEFSKYLDKKYGKGTAELMERNSKWITRRTRYDIESLTNFYKAKIKEL